MTKIAMSIGATLAITCVVAFLVYGGTSALTGLQPPSDASPAEFLVSVLVVKLGLAVGFVVLYFLARPTWERHWMRYALVWWGTFAIAEVGQAIGPNYSWTEAGAGIIAEAIYCPLAAWATAALLRAPDKAPVA